MAFLGFAGFDLWPLAFVAFVPLLAALEIERRTAHGRPRARRVLGIGWLFGTIGIGGGYYWIVEMLERFSGFPSVANWAIATLMFAVLGGMFALFGWLWTRATGNGHSPVLAAVLAWASVELLYPNIFPFFYGASLHPVPLLMQVAEIGGPILVGSLCLGVAAALFEVGRALFLRQRVPRVGPVVVVVGLAVALAYGWIRMGQVDAWVASAPKLDVGLVQVNMGIFDKREDPYEGHRRHLEQTVDLERRHGALDLVVWPESAFTFLVPEGMDNVKHLVKGPVSSPLIFGGLSRRTTEDGEVKLYNTAFLVDGEGAIQGTYDKTYLLAFGEYIPFGDVFPILYEWSPHTGRFTPGSHVRPLELGGWRITTLVCYEDILPGFVRDAVHEGDPHLLVNITNDAWFGDTHEPWIHLALAKFRTIEHRRFLVRSTNSGVSAVVDPAGRVVTHGGVFTRETLHSEIAMMEGSTPFALWGQWPWVLAVAGILVMAFGRPRRRSATRPAGQEGQPS